MTNKSPIPRLLTSSLSALDTTAVSLAHRVYRYGDLHTPLTPQLLLAIYLAAIAMTLLPLLVGAMLSPLSMTVVTDTARLPFLYDWNVLFMFLVSFPTLVILLVNDQRVLSSSLRSVEADGTITISELNAHSLNLIWRVRFRNINIIGQLAGLVVGGIVVFINYSIYISKTVGYWIAMDDHLLFVGYIYLYCIFIFYWVISILIVRSIAIAVFLKNVVEKSTLSMLPLHPDKSGGLRPMGWVGLRNQYILTILGLNIVILVAVSLHYLQVPNLLWGLIVVAALAYLILGPVVFVAPLMPFRAGMLRNKAELMSEVAQRLRVELLRLRDELKFGSISKADDELIDRLRKVGSVIDELPVWPFDAGTLHRFITAYVIPIISTVGYSIAKAVFEFAKNHIP